MAENSIENIQVVFSAVVSRFTQGLQRAQMQLKKTEKNMISFGGAMRLPIDNMKRLTNESKKMINSGGTLALRIREMTHGMRGFRMEMLGVMFFGMSLTRIFSSLTRTSMEWMGTTEILSSSLGLLFLPVAEKLSNWALKFLDWVDKLTESQKKWIGNIVLVVGALGILLTIIGTLALGVGSLILVFGGMAAAITKMTMIGVVILGVGLIVKGVIDVIDGKLEGLGLIIMGIGFILLAFIGWWALIPIAVGAAAFLVIKHWKTVKGWFSSFWGWLKGIFGKIRDFFADSLIGKAFSFIGGVAGKVLGSFQTGGIVPQTGPYMLHQGETVVPTGQGNGDTTLAPTINIQANVSSDYDVGRLADELKRYWVEDFDRVSAGRGL